MQAPTPNQLVEALFTQVLEPPLGYNYHIINFQLLYPVFGQDKWRLLLKRIEIPPTIKEPELVPVFIEGAFILKLTKALNAMQRELNTAVSEEIGEPVKH